MAKLSKDDATAMLVITMGSLKEKQYTEPQEEAKDGVTPEG